LLMRWKNRLWTLAVPALALVACGSFDGVAGGGASARSRPQELPPVAVPEPVKLGEPYTVGGETIAPKDEINYASWYGDREGGQDTGNGEAFNPDAVSAAHRTLPMPSYVEVTDLNSGRTILVRINDRGPFAKGRILDLSPGAAAQLGVAGQGHIPVRVRRVNPPEFERNALRNGGKATERLATPPGLLNALRLKLKDAPVPKDVAMVKPEPGKPMASKPVKAPPPKPAPKPAVMPKPADTAGADFPPPDAAPSPTPGGDDRFIVEEAAKPHWKARPAGSAKPMAAAKPASEARPATPTVSGSWFVQIGAFSNEASARALASKAGAQIVSAGPVFRVRTGPYASESAARQALGGLKAKGYRDARVSR
jgi:rare lipoprotein A